MQICTVVSPGPSYSCSAIHTACADLYGNDETDFTDQVEEKEEASLTEPALTEAQGPPPAKAAEAPSATPKPVAPAPIDTSAQQQQTYAIPTSQPSAASSYSPVTQQIPTYEQPLSPEYREPPPQRNDGGYQNIPVPERTVRPSEMKDEG